MSAMATAMIAAKEAWEQNRCCDLCGTRNDVQICGQGLLCVSCRKVIAWLDEFCRTKITLHQFGKLGGL